MMAVLEDPHFLEKSASVSARIVRRTRLTRFFCLRGVIAASTTTGTGKNIETAANIKGRIVGPSLPAASLLEGANVAATGGEPRRIGPRFWGLTGVGNSGVLCC
jgi:hypothetical protein